MIGTAVVIGPSLASKPIKNGITSSFGEAKQNNDNCPGLINLLPCQDFVLSLFHL